MRDFLEENFVFDGKLFLSLGFSHQLQVSEHLFRRLNGMVDKRNRPCRQGKRDIFDLPGSKPDRLNQVEIFLKNVECLDIWSLVNYITTAQIDLDPMGNRAIEPLLKWLNAVYRQDPASRWITHPNANAYFDKAEGTFIELRSAGKVLEAVRGIFQSVQIRFGRLTLNVDTATTAFWTPNKNFIELVQGLTGTSVHQNIQTAFLNGPESFMSPLQRLVGIFFNVRHLSEARNSRKIKMNKWTKGNAKNMEFDFDNQGQSQRISVYK